MLKKEYWENRHKSSYGRYHRVTDFARFCYYNFLKDKKGKLLEICCGKGADAIFFHNKGFKVTALDYSKEAIQQFNEKQKEYDLFVSNVIKDITEPLNFDKNSFEFVYCRLGIHYFTDTELKAIITEISRILKYDGLLMIQTKSVSDKKYGIGEKIEQDMFKDEEGYVRHFFSKEYVETLFSDYEILMNEERKIEEGSSYRELILKFK